MPKTPESGSLTRGVLLLKVLATAGPKGLALSDIATKSGLPHPSAHRVLRQLEAERLVDRNPELKRYRLGPLAFELGIASSVMFDIRGLCERYLDDLSRATQNTVYLIVRSEFDAVCLDRREGSFPIRTFELEVGSRRPLGVGAGGLAILAAIVEPERSEIVDRVAATLADFGGLTPKSVCAACLSTNELGSAVIRDKVNLGVTAIGQPFRDAMKQPIGAITVAALSQSMTENRIRFTADLLRDACAEIEQTLRARKPNGWLAPSEWH